MIMELWQMDKRVKCLWIQFIEFAVIGVLLTPPPFDVYCACKPAPHQKRCFPFCPSSLNANVSHLCVCARVGTCLTCTLRATQHGSASTLSTSGSCSWCKAAEMNSSVAREVTNSHTHDSLYIYEVKSPYLAFPVKRLVNVTWVWWYW